MNWQPPTPYTYQAPAPPPATRSGFTPAAFVAIGCAVILLIGSFMPWVSVRTAFGNMSVGGLEGDGKLTAAAAVGAIALVAGGAAGRIRVLIALGSIAGAIGAALAAYDIFDISDKIGDMDNEFARASVGVGLYVCLLSGIATFISGMIAQSEIR